MTPFSKKYFYVLLKIRTYPPSLGTQNIFYKLSILLHYDYTFYFVMAMLEGEIITILLHSRFSLFF